MFAVGGGGGGYVKHYSQWTAGGGGGYTKTENSVYLEQNKEYIITIGTGASSSGQGGATSGFSVTANGGYGGNHSNSPCSGGSGGSEHSGGSTSLVPGATDGASISGSGTGQGTTTREFSESNGALYSTGGSSGSNSTIIDVVANTGDGGSAMYSSANTNNDISYNGASGILIIRNHRE